MSPRMCSERSASRSPTALAEAAEPPAAVGGGGAGGAERHVAPGVTIDGLARRCRPVALGAVRLVDRLDGRRPGRAPAGADQRSAALYLTPQDAERHGGCWRNARLRCIRSSPC